MAVVAAYSPWLPRALRLSNTAAVLVTLLSDFGTADGYVGAMKGVVATLAPSAHILDMTHDIAPQDIRGGAWALTQATRSFPEGSIHVAVVDPGVGTARRALLVRAQGRLYLGPDNGLLSWVQGAETADVWTLDNKDLFRQPVSATFHGRDVFASVAGHLAAGIAPDSCGTTFSGWVRLPWPRPREAGSEILGETVHVDRFGNLITNIGADLVHHADSWQVWVGDHQVGGLRSTFGEVAVGSWVAYLGSGGTVEIGVRNGSAAAMVGRNERIKLCRCAD